MTAFFKLSGAGNDFLGLVEPPGAVGAAEVRAWCRRGLSLGADGLFVLRRTPRGARMDHFNADGTAAELCLNGTRCAVQLALDLGWADSSLEIETGAGPVSGRRLADGRVALSLPRPAPPVPHTASLEGTPHPGWRATVGVPHFVLLWLRHLGDAPVATLGARLRAHPDFAPAGANVDFVRFVARRRIELRTYERGVEAETLACGSGALAAVAVGLEEGALELPVEALTLGGHLLRVDAGEKAGEWSLAGDARILARGELRPEAAELPQPAAWS